MLICVFGCGVMQKNKLKYSKWSTWITNFAKFGWLMLTQENDTIIFKIIQIEIEVLFSYNKSLFTIFVTVETKIDWTK